MNRFVMPSIIAVAMVLFLLAQSSGSADVSKKAPDGRFLLGFLAGEYRVVGQKADSGPAYSGRMTLRKSGRAFVVTQVIAGVTSYGTASIETAGEGVTVLRMRFPFDGVEDAATYVWQTDPDNYPRLTGYLYLSQSETKSPGPEAISHVPPTPAK